MKVTESWLREWCNPSDQSLNDIAHTITMAGLEVDGIDFPDHNLDGVLVGKIVRTESHPNADKLQITFVDIGQSDLLQIVCGAPNAREGILVPVATIGTVLPDNITIKAAKLRDIDSSGMLCSAKELNIGEELDGLMELANHGAHDRDIGKNIVDVLQLNDPAVDIDLTPNRGDCLSLRGIAREVSVLTNTDYTPPTITAVTPIIDDTIEITVAAEQDCPRYLGRVIKGINPSVATPIEIQNRLRQVGIRTHSLAVDITNYVMLSLGQPMHSFDLDTLTGNIVVRSAQPEETLQLLNDKTVALPSGTLLITDDTGPIAIAGIMGGAKTEITPTSQNIFLESAFFSPLAVAGRAREFGLQTDASHRFERGVALDIQKDAIEWATALILQAAGGEAGPVIEAEASDHIQKPSQEAIALSPAQISSRLGIEIDHDRVTDIFINLGFDTTVTDTGWQVMPPAWRFDIEIAADLIEELARIYGYHEIPATRPAVTQPRPSISEKYRTGQHIKQQLAQLGYAEVVAYSFIPKAHNQQFYEDRTGISLANPISQEMSDMRTSLLPGLLQTAQLNHSRAQKDCKLFDMGIVFNKPDRDALLPTEKAFVAGVITGKTTEHWITPSTEVDFYSLKGDVDTLLSGTLSLPDDQLVYQPATIKGFHPGQCAEILLNNNIIGVIGKVHPTTAKTFTIKTAVFAFELTLDALLPRRSMHYHAISKLPASRRDIAVIVKEEISYQTIVNEIESCHIPSLSNIHIFDVYQDDKLGEGVKSLAIGLEFQPDTETLRDETVDGYIQTVVDQLSTTVQARLRDA